MKQSLIEAMNSYAQIFNPPTQPPPTARTHHTSTPKSTPSIPKQSCKISRRDLTICAPSSALLSLLAVVIDPSRHSKARADEGPSEENPNTDSEVPLDRSQITISNGGEEENATPNSEEIRSEENSNAERIVSVEEAAPEVENSNGDGCREKTPTQRAFLDISIDGEQAGRIVIGLYKETVPAGATSFSRLVSGAAGISYRRKEFVKIVPNYIQHGGVRSYGVDVELAKRRGSDLQVDSLVGEWEKQVGEKCPPGPKNVAGTVGIIVRDPTKPPPKLKLVARKGKLEIDEEEVGKDPNGTEFVISTRDSPELDSSALVIGRVVEGMDVVEKISKVKTVQDNTGSPYFRYFPFPCFGVVQFALLGVG